MHCPHKAFRLDMGGTAHLIGAGGPRHRPISFPLLLGRGPPKKKRRDSWTNAAGSEAARTRHRGEAVPGGGGSVFLRQHDREDTLGYIRVGRVGRAVVEVTIVAIDLPEDRLAGILEAAEIVLAVGIVVRRKGDEAMNAPHDLDLLLRRHGGNARGNEDAALTGEGSPERIVQLANSCCRIHTLLM